ncbi:MAG: leucyl/phenylalanyl-tRNA--protein transferase [Proteobacteria bacterium]|jgi:leucyl/phenylalanyl-tRNA--protein transferase|nr:leucyl/phenylalanyl-tRNA--protein transferase [Pseudomonadota bacterium]
MTAPYWLNPHIPDDFPDVSLALRDPDGLLALGGDLTVERLLAAYRRGIFPWYSEDQPILWWSPDPRSVLFPDKLHVSRSLRKTLRQGRFDVSLDQDFAAVINACSEPRPDQPGTWITDEMCEAYLRLHQTGHAHSVETRLDGRLVGGLYGVAIGRVFFGESMFSRVNDASKVAFITLVQHLRQYRFELIDCQIQTPHLDSLGAELIPRQQFTDLLSRYCNQPGLTGVWQLDPAVRQALAGQNRKDRTGGDGH